MRRPELARSTLLPLVLAALLACAPPCSEGAHAEDTPQAKLDAIEKALAAHQQQQRNLGQQAAVLAADLAQLRSQEIAAAQSAQAHEAALNRLDAQLASLDREVARKSAELARKRDQESAVLAALLHIARNPPIGLALTEGSPIDLLRGGILMGAAVPPLVDHAERLGIEISTLADLKSQLQDAEARHRIEADALAKEQTRLAALSAQKSALQQKASFGAADSASEVQRLAAQAGDLRDLIARADAEAQAREAREERERQVEAARQAAAQRRAAEAEAATSHRGLEEEAAAPALAAPPLADPTRPATIRPFGAAKGKMLIPAVGSIVTAYGDADSAGPAKGITIETRPGAEVVAPFDGRVVYAGAFKGYGQILIIRHDDGYHSLVAGLDRIDAGVGQWLVAGEPIGSMPAAEAKPRLYLELRHDGQPINPSPWLATAMQR